MRSKVKHQAAVRAWQAANPDKVRESRRKWQAANREKMREYTRAWNAANPERHYASARAWRAANPKRWRALQRVAQHNRKLQKRGFAPVRRAEIATLWKEYAGLCAYCLNPATSLDHVEPLSRGGAHHISNLVPACGPCNSSKGNRTLLVWLSRRDFVLRPGLTAAQYLADAMGKAGTAQGARR